MKPELFNQLTLGDLKEIVTTADSVALDDNEYPTEKDYYEAVREKLKEQAK